MNDRVITAMAADLAPEAREEVLDARGGPTIPGLHDHHVHLMALAAASASVPAGPPEVNDRAQLATVLRIASARMAEGEWLRAVGYHESVAGDIDRTDLDALVGDRPVRVQHRSGILWVLNSAGLAAVGAGTARRPGIERDADSVPTGRLWREDVWLRSRLPQQAMDLSALSRAAATLGVTGFTDATSYATAEDLRTLVESVATGAIVQRLCLMSGSDLDASRLGSVSQELSRVGVALGPVKILLDDDRLPSLDDLVAEISGAHRSGRSVAIHCVTRVQAVLAVATIEMSGSRTGDRIEHGAVLGPDLLAQMRRLGLIVVTQPAFVFSRGERYLEDVEEADRPDLWRLGSLIQAGLAVAGGSDAPYGPVDPWVAVAAAINRKTADGRVLGPAEAIPMDPALRLYQGHAMNPAAARSVGVGQPSDLCVLREPIMEIPGGFVHPTVLATVVRGAVVYLA
jgi:predicted amidohydrolase YtcJ